MTRTAAARAFAALVPLAALAVPLCGCGAPGILDDAARTSRDPAIAAPRASSFIVEDEIRVDWDRDEAADEYLLEVSSGRIPSTYEIAYRGLDTAFVAEGCEDQGLYLFRLTKMRGDKAFGPSIAALGVGSAVRRDRFEPNDRECEAVDLGFVKSANLYYYRAFDGTEIGDEDWYSLTVPPQMIAYVVIEQTDPEIEGTGQTSLLLYRPGQLEARIRNNVEIPLRNDDFEPKALKFRIGPFVEDFVSGLGAEGGGAMVDYGVRLYAVVKG